MLIFRDLRAMFTSIKESKLNEPLGVYSLYRMNITTIYIKNQRAISRYLFSLYKIHISLVVVVDVVVFFLVSMIVNYVDTMNE
jgi:hypothetical protein